MTTQEAEATAQAGPLVISALPPETHEIVGPDDHPPEPMLSGLMKKAAMWSGINAFALRLAQFSVGVVSARIIAPKEFGIYAVALTVYAIIINVNELGVSAALARTKRPVDEIAPTVATIAIASSSFFTLIMFFTAPALARLLGAPDAANSVRILSSVVVMGGITAVPYALLVRNFQQDKRFLADGSNVVASTVVVIALGLSGFGATALALSKVVGQLVSVVLLLSTIKPRYRPGWNRVYAREVLVYSLPLAAATVVEFTLGNVDYIVVGHMMGALALGYYTLAYNISGWPVSVFGLMINEVALPAFARAQDDRTGLSRRVSGAFALTATVAMPVSTICLALGHPLVAAVYGSRWSPAAAALAILGLFGSMRIVLTLFSNILAALGDSRGVFLLQAVWIAVLIPALIVGVRWHGIVGAAVAQEVVVVLVVLPLALRLISRAGGGRASRLLSVTAFPAGAAVLAGLAAWAVSFVLTQPILQVLVGALVGIGLYALIVGRWARQLLKDARGHWNELSSSSSATEEVSKPARGRHRWDKHRHGPTPRTAARRQRGGLAMAGAAHQLPDHHA